MKKMHLLYLVHGAVIAALYVVLTMLVAPIAFGPIQFRFSEALTVLPILTGVAVPGLFVGCLIANIFLGSFYDIVFS